MSKKKNQPTDFNAFLGLESDLNKNKKSIAAMQNTFAALVPESKVMAEVKKTASLLAATHGAVASAKMDIPWIAELNKTANSLSVWSNQHAVMERDARAMAGILGLGNSIVESAGLIRGIEWQTTIWQEAQKQQKWLTGFHEATAGVGAVFAAATRSTTAMESVLGEYHSAGMIAKSIADRNHHILSPKFGSLVQGLGIVNQNYVEAIPRIYENPSLKDHPNILQKLSVANNGLIVANNYQADLIEGKRQPKDKQYSIFSQRLKDAEAGVHGIILPGGEDLLE